MCRPAATTFASSPSHGVDHARRGVSSKIEKNTVETVETLTIQSKRIETSDDNKFTLVAS